MSLRLKFPHMTLTLAFILTVSLLMTIFFSLEASSQSREYQRAANDLEDLIDRISDVYDDRVFFHVWLQQKFKSTDVPEKFAGLVRSTFKKYARLIIWDSNGNVIQNLSDEKRFQYILRKMVTFLRPLTEQIKISSKINSADHPLSVDSLALFRKYFGEMLFPQLMRLPLYPGIKGRVLEVSREKTKGYLWYQTSKNYSAAIFLDSSLKNRKVGLKSLATSFNSRKSDFRIGFFDSDSGYIGPEMDESRLGALKIHGQNYRNSVFGIQTTKAFHSLFKQLSPEIQVFALKFRTREDSKAMILASFIFRVFIIFFFIQHCYCLRQTNVFSSIKVKIVNISLLAAILPSAFLMAIGNEFLNYRIATLVSDRQLEGYRLLKETDTLYPLAKQRIAAQITETLNQFYAKIGDDNWTQEIANELAKRLKKYHPTIYGIFHPPSKIEIVRKDGDSQFPEKKIMTKFPNEEINDLRSSRNLQRIYSQRAREGFSDDFEWLGGSVNDRGKIMLSKLLFFECLTYWFHVGRPEINPGQIFLVWEIEKFQDMFLEKELEKINRTISPGKIMFMFKNSRRVFPGNLSSNYNFQRFLRKAYSGKLIFADPIKDGKHEFVATAMRCLNFEAASLAYIYPRSLIEAEIASLRMKALIGIMLFLSTISIIFWKFSSRRIEPVTILESGLKAVSNKNFNIKLDFNSNDEFDDLIKTFNSSIENMKDLAVARLVQESLLPPSDFLMGKLKIHAETSFMTSMGGDYFDIAATGKKVLIAFGDVSGHGVSAALVMAMIKAVFVECIDSGNSESFLEKCNQVLLHLKLRGWNRMMTLQTLVIDSISGEFSILNAGQCFPALVSDIGQKIEFLDIPGKPLGFKISRGYNQLNGILKTGDYLVLYSDGIIEAINHDCEPFGIGRLEEILKNVHGNDPTNACRMIINAGMSWSSMQSDDLSIMVVRFGS